MKIGVFTQSPTRDDRLNGGPQKGFYDKMILN